MQLNTKHQSFITDKEGKVLMSFSIDHHKGAKDQIKLPYINTFRKLVKTINESET